MSNYGNTNGVNVSAGRTGGVSILGLLGVAFVVLKLCHVITWSWWLVLLPFYVGFAAALVMLLAAIVLFGVAGIIDHYNKTNKKK